MGQELGLAENDKEGAVHVHFLHRHVPALVSDLAVIFLIAIAGFTLFLFVRGETDSTPILLKNDNGSKQPFVYGSWPALENADFFNGVKNNFIAEGASFIEADLSGMIIRFYENGKFAKEAPIMTKGRDGSWWETPAGLYRVLSKEKNHFSSFGNVYMPWSMQFQGNFFIHGPTYYPDGSPTASSYSGGCIRIGLADAEEIYRLVKEGTPVLVFEKSFGGGEELDYEQKKFLPDGVSYLAADLENNFVFAANAPKNPRSIASITKLTSALVAVEYINVEKEVIIGSSMLASTSLPRLKAGDRHTILDLLSLALMESSNEAAGAITAPLGESQFIKLMNGKAEAIGMNDSRFVDASGVLSGNTSSAEDLFLLAKYLYYNRSFVLHVTMGRENRIAYGPSRFPNVKNFNLIPSTTGLVGAKTGLSKSAGDSMLAVFEIEINAQTRPVAIIVLGSDDAKRDVKTLLEYIKENFLLESTSAFPSHP